MARLLFWSTTLIGLGALGYQVWSPSHNFIPSAQWVLPFGLTFAVAGGVLGLCIGVNISRRPLRKHEWDQLKHDNSPLKVWAFGPRVGVPSSQFPTILFALSGCLGFAGFGYLAPPIIATAVVGQTQTYIYTIADVDPVGFTRPMRIRVGPISTRILNPPNAVHRAAEPGDEVRIVGRGSSLGHFIETIDLR